MDHKEFFLRHWEKEGPATRKVIGRIPENRSDYRADPKARSARELAWIIVLEESALVQYDHHHDALTQRLRGLTPERWEEKLPFLYNGQEVMKEAGYEMAWGFLLDQVHHRGQLSTYLRPMGAKVPPIYGPSADEST